MEFFPGYQVEGESNYFVRDCADLTEDQKLEVKNTFVTTLNENNVCADRASKSCDIKDMAIICGLREVRRRKRGVDETLQSIDFSFNITALKIINTTTDCPKICAMRRIPARFCDRLCSVVHRRYLQAAVMYAKQQVDKLYQTDEGKAKLAFSAASREFEPESATTSDLIIECPEGMMSSNGYCGE